MNADELKKADEIVRELRDPENCDVLDYIDDAADLIDSLTAQLASVTADRDAAVNDIAHDCYHCKHKPDAEAPKDEYGCRKCGCGCGVNALETRNAQLCHWEWRGPQEAEKGAADGN